MVSDVLKKNVISVPRVSFARSIDTEVASLLQKMAKGVYDTINLPNKTISRAEK